MNEAETRAEHIDPALADAVADLGKPEEIGRLFAGFQNCLYGDKRGYPRVSD